MNEEHEVKCSNIVMSLVVCENDMTHTEAGYSQRLYLHDFVISQTEIFIMNAKFMKVINFTK